MSADQLAGQLADSGARQARRARVRLVLAALGGWALAFAVMGFVLLFSHRCG